MLQKDDGFFTENTACEKVCVGTVNGRSEINVFTIEKMEIYCGDRVNIIENAAIGVSRERLGEYDLILPHAFAEDVGGKGRSQ